MKIETTVTLSCEEIEELIRKHVRECGGDTVSVPAEAEIVWNIVENNSGIRSVTSPKYLIKGIEMKAVKGQ